MLGVVSAVGSIGALVVPLVTQALLAREPWQIGALFFMLMAIAMLPASVLAGGADKMQGHSTTNVTMREVLGQAMTLIGFAAGVVQILAGGPTRGRDRMIAPAVATT